MDDARLEALLALVTSRLAALADERVTGDWERHLAAGQAFEDELLAAACTRRLAPGSPEVVVHLGRAARAVVTMLATQDVDRRLPEDGSSEADDYLVEDSLVDPWTWTHAVYAALVGASELLERLSTVELRSLAPRGVVVAPEVTLCARALQRALLGDCQGVAELLRGDIGPTVLADEELEFWAAQSRALQAMCDGGHDMDQVLARVTRAVDAYYAAAAPNDPLRFLDLPSLGLRALARPP